MRLDLGYLSFAPNTSLSLTMMLAGRKEVTLLALSAVFHQGGEGRKGMTCGFLAPSRLVAQVTVTSLG